MNLKDLLSKISLEQKDLSPAIDGTPRPPVVNSPIGATPIPPATDTRSVFSRFGAALIQENRDDLLQIINEYNGGPTDQL